MRVMIRFPVDTLHTYIILSADPDAKYSPFGENTMLKTLSECPVRVMIRSPLDALHTPIVLSADPDAKYSPFGEDTTLKTLFRVSCEGFDSFSARYSPYFYNPVQGSRPQILSVRRKYYAIDWARVTCKFE